MTIGFDMDEVITRYPIQCRQLMRSLKNDGWKILVISPNPLVDIEEKLNRFQCKEFVDKIVNRGDKGNACRDEGVDVFLDDNEGYLSQVLDSAQNTMPLKVLRK